MARNLEVVCIDDSKQPADLPNGCKVLLGETYTVEEISIMAMQSGVYGYKLAEIKFPEGCKYQRHLARRFRPKTDDDRLFEEELRTMVEELGTVELERI